MRKYIAAVVSLVALAAGIAWPGTANAATDRIGSVTVTITAPEGVPGSVQLVGPNDQRLIAKPTAGTSFTTTIDVNRDHYQVMTPAFTFDDKLYQGTVSVKRLRVRKNKTVALNVSYAPVPAVADIQVTALQPDSISLSWTVPAEARVMLRRTAGTVPAAGITDGVAVTVNANTATDTGLSAATQFSYAIFTQIGADWAGPASLTIGTPAPPGSSDATYITSPNTILANADDVVSETPTGSGVQVAFADNVAAPMMGAGVVLPISPALQGGFLGVVTSVSADGHLVGLTPGAISDAFDYYDLNVVDLSGFTQDPGTGDVPTSTTPGAPVIKESSAKRGTPVDPAAKGRQLSAAVSSECTKSASGPKFTLNVKPKFGGKFSTKIIKKKFYFVNVPVGASFDAALSVTEPLTASLATSAGITCDVDLGTWTKQLTVDPVPIAIKVALVGSLSANGKLSITDVGATATAGVNFSGSVTVTDGFKMHATPFYSVEVLTPKATVNGSLNATLGGNLIFGPGIGTTYAGIIAGVSGQLNVLDAIFTPVFQYTDSRFNHCITAKAGADFQLALSMQAWLDFLKEAKTYTLLSKSVNYPGSPWYLPVGCNKLAPIATPTPTAAPSPSPTAAPSPAPTVAPSPTPVPPRPIRLAGPFTSVDYVTAADNNQDYVGQMILTGFIFTPVCQQGVCVTHMTRTRQDNTTTAYDLTPQADGSYTGIGYGPGDCFNSSRQLVAHGAYDDQETLTLTPTSATSSATAFTGTLTRTGTPTALGIQMNCPPSSETLTLNGTLNP